MKYKHIFFDLDHTLWDFNANAEESLSELYNFFNLESKAVAPFTQFYSAYLNHNAILWNRYEKGFITTDELKWRRMRRTLLDFKIADEKLEFNPSAIAVHPVTHDIYLLSTRDNKCMAVYSHQGILKAFQYIDAELMPQPEGICFSPDGKLYISSEGKKGEPGNLFEFDVLK